MSTSECIKLVPLLKLDSISSCSLITLKFRTIAVGSIVIRFYTVMRGCWKREAWLGLIESFLRLSIIEYFNFTIEDLQKELNSKHLSFSQIILNSKVSTCFCYRFACLYQGATALADHSRPSTFQFVARRAFRVCYGIKERLKIKAVKEVKKEFDVGCMVKRVRTLEKML